jgi:hypothetical protein
MLFHHVLTFVNTATLGASVVAAASSITKSRLPLRSTSLDIEELTSKLLHGPIHQPEVYTRAVSILESLEAAPSCYRMATLTLINSCQSLERSKTAEVALAEVREEYATRLAICEFMGARVAFPPQCNLFVPQDRGCKKRVSFSFWDKPRGDSTGSQFTGDTCYRDVGSAQVKQCLSALHARPQWWTSYSNALQNVVVVCQASRSSVEKGKLDDELTRFFELCVLCTCLWNILPTGYTAAV